MMRVFFLLSAFVVQLSWAYNTPLPPPTSTATTMRGGARFFLDSASVEVYEELLPTGIFHGVTTNPTLLEEAQQPCTVFNLQRLAQFALQFTDEFMCQTWGMTSDEMYNIGMQLSSVDPRRIVIKVPVTAVGVKVAHQLQRSNIRTCLTACYNSKQALIAANLGCEYIAPYLGRMDKAGKNGQQEVQEMTEIIRGLKSQTRVLVASISEVESIQQLSRTAGADTFTFSPDVCRQLFDEPLTEEAAEVFQASAERGENARPPTPPRPPL